MKAGLSDSLEGWPYSSFEDYLGNDAENLCSISLARELLDLPANDDEFKKISYQVLNEKDLGNIF
ncbi:hypothetical protein [Rhodohalobacter sp. 8-1]|uniref:hypothetical protein n=1 Tax=Rhodohalobacter sp. 8-1 TaxID=3131972 RepID=UPI0030EF0AD9